MRPAILTIAAALVGTPAMLTAQATATMTPQATVTLTQEKPGLLAQAKVTDDAAREAALARVPGGSIVKAELEQEKGKLIYSYDVAVPGKDGIEEVTVDASTGAVLAVEHESAAEEAKEDSADAAKKSN
jgi:uncharacterized membrane protein YkoI